MAEVLDARARAADLGLDCLVPLPGWGLWDWSHLLGGFETGRGSQAVSWGNERRGRGAGGSGFSCSLSISYVRLLHVHSLRFPICMLARLYICI